MKFANFLIVMAVLLIPTYAFPAVKEQDLSRKEQIEIEELKRQSKVTQDSIQEIRRDQLNYKIEKDLLKDSYTTSLQTINAIITIVLGIFAVLTYFGFRGIRELRREYADELGKLSKLHQEFEVKVNTITKEQEAAKDNLLNILKTNEDQNRRIKVLEIQEKVGQLMTSGDHPRALEYIAVGLSLDPNDITLLNQKGLCYGKLSDFTRAVEVEEEILKIDPTYRTAITNLAEFYLLTNRIADYEQHVTKNSEIIDASHSGGLRPYFETVKYFMKSDLANMKKVIGSYVAKCSPEASKRLGAWDYFEIKSRLQKYEDTQEKRVLLSFIDFLDGQKNVSTLNALIAVNK